MARIRTVKPKTFRHYDLFRAEQETGLPLRLAYIALWTCCDREGRFKWEPAELKLDCLPHDQIDFSRVLHALTTRGFVVRYEVDGEAFGWVPKFSKHQVINNREAPSELPQPPENNTELTREARVDDASATRHDLAQAEEERTLGREGKGMERERERASAPDARALSLDFSIPEEWKQEAADRRAESELDPVNVDAEATKWLAHNEGRVVQNPHGAFVKWIMGARADLAELPADRDGADPPSDVETIVSAEPWAQRLRLFRKNPSTWKPNFWGAPPGSPGCRVPRVVLEREGVHTA